MRLMTFLLYFCLILVFSLQSYLNKYKFGNAKTEDLWNSLTEVDTITNSHLRVIFFKVLRTKSNKNGGNEK